MYETASLKEVKEKDTDINNSGILETKSLKQKGNKQTNKEKNKKQMTKKLSKHCTLVDIIMHTY